MQFSTERFDVGPARRVSQVLSSRRTAAVLPIFGFVIGSALAAGVLTRTADADGSPSGPAASEQVAERASTHPGVPSPAAADACAYYIASGWTVPVEYGCASPGQVSSAQRLNESHVGPTDVIDAFLAAQGVDDVEAAAAFFETHALITDSSGHSAFGTDAVRPMIQSLQGWEAGPRQATGDEVTWAESLPIWKLPNPPTEFDLRLEQEVPHYAYTHLMCAVVADNGIHALIALAAGSQRSCPPALP